MFTGVVSIAKIAMPHVFWGVGFGGVSFTNYKGFSCRQAPNPHIKKGLKKGMEPGEQKTHLSFTVKKRKCVPKVKRKEK